MPRRLINKRHISNELDEVIDANLNESHDLLVGVVLKAIARELSAFDLDRDADKLPNNPLARLIYMYVSRDIKERMACKRA
jgi:hypothetical protein